jgi:hypothetical protein
MACHSEEETRSKSKSKKIKVKATEESMFKPAGKISFDLT